jgi:hypothetical protein
MFLQRLIRLVTALCLIAAMIGSLPARAFHIDENILPGKWQKEKQERLEAWPPGGTAVSAAVLPNIHPGIVAPLLVSLAIWILGCRVRHLPVPSPAGITPSPPFLASASRHTYLRISVLLI